jgi:cytosine/adenosine deaminase-related metal-dependent hydrolase
VSVAESLLIRDIHTLVTMDARDTVLRGGYVYAEDGEIRQVGARVPAGLRAARTLRAPYAIAIPGLVNTHHHLYQTLTRACRAAADVELFNWLKILYPLWARLDEEALHVAALVGMSELLLSGCTTTTDHHYVFPRGQDKMIDAEISAARRIGIRFHPTRGSMSVGQSRGGLPPDSVVQSEECILADCERLIARYHDPAPGSMLRIALAPCSPFSVSEALMRSTADMAQRHGVRLHTHLAETRDEDAYCRQSYGRRPLEFLSDSGWLGGQTWLAHGVWFRRPEIARLGRAGVGVAHCPTSNMRLGSGVAPVLALRRAGALRMATVEGARCLGRDDIGSLEPGKRADLALFDLRDAAYSGATDAVSALLLCAPATVETLIVEGRVLVEDHALQTVRMEPLRKRHRRIAARVVGTGPLV